MILAAETGRGQARRLKDSVRAGGTLLYVAARPGPGETLATLLESPVRPIEEATPSREVLIGEIAFDHPLFAPFASPQYSDFTKIHFWKHRKIAESTREGEAPVEPNPTKARTKGVPPAAKTRVLARFENGDPAVLEKPIGKGSVVVMASGWNPDDSQLARSSKFVPMMMALLDRHDTRPFDVEEHTVGDPIALPESKEAGRA